MLWITSTDLAEFTNSVILQVEMEFLNNYIYKLNERKFQNERNKTLHSRSKSQ